MADVPASTKHRTAPRPPAATGHAPASPATPKAADAPAALARAFCNNEVGYLAWRVAAPIPGCLGFMVIRVITSGEDQGSRRILPAWVAFKGQSNPRWLPQDTSVWPVQKFAWRDLTLRRLRDGSAVREAGFTCRYEITPVGQQASDGQPARPPVPPPDPPVEAGYTGNPIPLFVCGPTLVTNEITVTSKFGAVTATFNNGILSTQNLRQLLGVPDGAAPAKALVSTALQTVGGKVRAYLAGDILPLVRSVFARAQNEDLQLFAALYELNDPELIGLIEAHKERVSLILTTAGHGDGPPGAPASEGSDSPDAGVTGPRQKPWDTTNAAVRPKLHAWLGERMQDRMFNTAARIGHNKFVVLASRADPPVPVAVLTGSTNWTFTGLAGQSNNALLIEDAAVAAGHLGYWRRLHADAQPVPDPISAPLNSRQGPALRRANMAPVDAAVQGGRNRDKTSVRLWYAPNTVQASKGSAVPPDLADVFAAMDAAKQAIFLLCFYPGAPSVIDHAVQAARDWPDLLVQGAVSAPEALPGAQKPITKQQVTLPNGKVISIPSPAVTPAEIDGHPANRLLMVRATALRVGAGDLQPELLTTGVAIIHDKIIVIDPMSAADCVVITGSHNLGFKASYCNDENLVILRGNQPLAAAYAAHVLDLFEHYRFRAVQEERTIEALRTTGNLPQQEDRGGFLSRDDGWQAGYFDGSKGEDRDYVLS